MKLQEALDFVLLAERVRNAQKAYYKEPKSSLAKGDMMKLSLSLESQLDKKIEILKPHLQTLIQEHAQKVESNGQ